MKENKVIILVGGGTGGHVTPLLSVAESLLEKGVNSNSIYLITDKVSAKQDYVLGHRINIKIIPGGKFNRFFTLRNLATPFLVLAGFFASYFFLRKVRPDVVLAKGAYLSLPVVYAAKVLGIPVYLHESDSVMGVTNRRLAPKAEKIFVSFPTDFYSDDLRSKLEFSGLPIRKLFFQKMPEESLGKRIVIWGGSQGAEGINELIIKNLEEYLISFNLFHICGEKHFEKYDEIRKNLPDELKKRYYLYGIIGKEIFKIISQAALVISRAGATSLFELAALARPAIIIPYPAAAADHQTKNADYFTQNDAIILIKEDELDADALKKAIFETMEDRDKREKLSKNIENLAQREASERISKQLLI